MTAATTSRAISAADRPATTVAEQLWQEPYRFDFFQAVRLLRLISRKTPSAPRKDVGRDHPPHEEIARFRALASLRFPAAEVYSLQNPESGPPDDTARRSPEMVVSLAGLTGPSGVLPRHYTQLMIDRIRGKDFALRDFLDLLNHRIISLFYRAWEKYHFPIAYENLASDPDAGEEDVLTRCLYCLVGMGTGGLRNRLSVPDEVFLYYGGLLAHFPRNAVSLEAMIEDYFHLPVNVLQFHGQWLYLSPDNQSSLMPLGQHRFGNNQLGMNVVVGQRVWGVENKFRIRLGPLGYTQFRRFTPMGDQLVPLGQLVRSYVGPDFDFDIQPVLRRDQVPCAQLGEGTDDRSYLGWNTWIRSLPAAADARDAVFETEDCLA